MADVRVSRPDLDSYFMAIARAASTRATCRHRAQGVVLVKDRAIISTGYNGAPPGKTHCLDSDCAKAYGLPCRAEGLHGESNAILSAAKRGISTDGSTAYCIYSPCRACCNMMSVAGIVCVVYQHVYDAFPEGPDYLPTLSIRVRQWKEPENGNE
jgi:dCMP deaminase